MYYIIIHFRASRIFRTAEINRNPGQNLVPKSAGKNETDRRIRNGAATVCVSRQLTADAVTRPVRRNPAVFVARTLAAVTRNGTVNVSWRFTAASSTAGFYIVDTD